MKKHLIYISLFIFLFSTTISAQKIGIKTTIPKAGTTLHIDAQGNTPAAATSNCEDDMIVDNDGKMAALPYTNPNGGNPHMWAQMNVVRIHAASKILKKRELSYHIIE